MADLNNLRTVPDIRMLEEGLRSINPEMISAI